VLENGVQVQKYTGTLPHPLPFTSSISNLRLVFHTDHSVVNSGFQAIIRGKKTLLNFLLFIISSQTF